MNPVSLLITLPPPGPERARLLGMTVGELLGLAPESPAPALRPHRAPEAEAMAAPDDQAEGQAPARDDRPTDGRQLLGWINKQPDPEKLRKLAQAHGRRIGAGNLFKSWTPAQVKKVYDRLNAQPWGGDPGRQAQ